MDAGIASVLAALISSGASVAVALITSRANVRKKSEPRNRPPPPGRNRAETSDKEIKAGRLIRPATLVYAVILAPTFFYLGGWMFGVFAVTGDFPYVLMVGNGSELREFLTFAISFGAIIVLFLGYVIGQILPRR